MSDSDYIIRRLPACNTEGVPYPEADVPPLVGQGYARVGLPLWEDYGKPETLEEWRKALQLSKSYAILSPVPPGVHPYFEFVIAHPAIPASVREGETHPVMNLRYHEEKDGEGKRIVTFRGVVIRQWDVDHWKIDEIPA